MANLADVIEISEPNILDNLYSCIVSSRTDGLIPAFAIQVKCHSY